MIPSEFICILDELPEFKVPPHFTLPFKHDVVHRIHSKSQLPSASARQLNHERLGMAKRQFKQMIGFCIFQISDSGVASRFKETLAFLQIMRRLSFVKFGNYTGQTPTSKRSRYLSRYFCKFLIFFKIDCIRAYHQNLIAEEDIFKIAVITPFGLCEFPRMLFEVPERNANVPTLSVCVKFFANKKIRTLI